MSKSKSTKQFPYDELHQLVDNEQEKKGGKSWTILSVVLFVFFGALSILVLFISSNPFDDAAFAFGLVVLVIAIIRAFKLLGDNVSRTSINNLYIRRIIVEIHAKPDKFTEIEIDNLARRADIGKNAGSIRILLPLLIIPLLVSFISNVVSMDRVLVLLLGYFLLAFCFLFLFELDRANTDEIILHAISEYQKKRKYAQVVEGRTEADEMTLRAIVETKKKYPHSQANEKRTSAEVSRLIRVHGTPVHQPPSQRSVASTNGVGADDKVAHCPDNER